MPPATNKLQIVKISKNHVKHKQPYDPSEFVIIFHNKLLVKLTKRFLQVKRNTLNYKLQVEAI